MTKNRFLAYFAFFAAGILPIAAAAQDAEYPTLPERDEIVFTPEIEVAFDRTGKFKTEKTLPTGLMIASQNSSMQNVTVARLGPNGKIETLCTESENRARDFLSGRDRGPRPVAPDHATRNSR